MKFCVLHISNNLYKFRYSLHNFINNSNYKYKVIFHELNYIDDQLFNNFEYSKITFNDILKYNNHLFYNEQDIITSLNPEINKNLNLFYLNTKNNQLLNYDYFNERYNLKLINCDLTKGFSFIIRAKNEELNVEKCLTSLKVILDFYKNSEIIFVDNNSSDNTFELAKNILQKYSNTKILKYNIDIPRCGQEHKEKTKNNKKISLGEYYKWCYSFASKNNVIKWDCDFLCNTQNLCKLINNYNLSETSNNLSIWFSGLQLNIYNNEMYINKKSYYSYNEPRVQSKLNGFEYINSPDGLWETPYTDYLIKNELNDKSYHCGFPTSYYLVRFLEIKKLQYLLSEKNIYSLFDKIYESKDKETIIKNLKNEKFYNNIKHFIKKNIKTNKDTHNICFNPLIKNNSIDICPIFYETKHINNMMKKFYYLRSLDSRDISIKKEILCFKNNNYKEKYEKSIYILEKYNLLSKKNIKICIVVLSCDKYKDRIANLKTKLLNNINFDYYIVRADQGLDSTQLKNNILTINCEECYENLPKKSLKAFEYLYNNFDYDYILKIDDDTTINIPILEKFIKNKFYYLDYLGGKAGGHVELEWHFGKCKNPNLNKKKYWNGYNGYWCGGGFGYILSRGSISILLKENNYKYICEEIYEDKSIGDVLRKYNILPHFEYLPNLKISKKLGMIGDDYLFISQH